MLSQSDYLIQNFDQILRTLFKSPKITRRESPASSIKESQLNNWQRYHTSRLMCINHAGEICAQGLYHGQALIAHNKEISRSMSQSAQEENDHLDWCESRLHELGGSKSLLNPFLYTGSFLIGIATGIIGDKWSLGFIAETERQVEIHLESHLKQVYRQDKKTRAILQQMKEDEISHRIKALREGGIQLPKLVQQTMKFTSKIMTNSVYYL